MPYRFCLFFRSKEPADLPVFLFQLVAIPNRVKIQNLGIVQFLNFLKYMLGRGINRKPAASIYGKSSKMPGFSVPTKRAFNCTKLEKLEGPFQPLFC